MILTVTLTDKTKINYMDLLDLVIKKKYGNKKAIRSYAIRELIADEAKRLNIKSDKNV
jgi:hypothetical protein